MTKKRVALTTVILVIILILCATAYAVYWIADINAQKKAAYEQNKRRVNDLIIELAYEIQNKAFFGIGIPEYMPYDTKHEWRLQTNIILYIRSTGEIITLSDVETFLASPMNQDGTPRTWEDDETGIIYDFVRWCLASKNAGALDSYRNDLSRIFVQYLIQNPDCQYGHLSDLTPEQIVELDKKYLDPEYDLVLAPDYDLILE